MSWNGYIDSMKNSCKKANGESKFRNGVLCDALGNQWAASPGFHPSQEELCELAKVCDKEGCERTKAYTDGIMLAGEKYTFVRADTDEKKVELKRGKLQCSAKKTLTGLVFCEIEGEYDRDPTASETVYGIGKHLENSSL